MISSHPGMGGSRDSLDACVSADLWAVARRQTHPATSTSAIPFGWCDAHTPSVQVLIKKL